MIFLVFLHIAGMVAHTFNSSTREAEAGRFLSSTPAWSTKWVPELYRETLSQKTTKIFFFTFNLHYETFIERSDGCFCNHPLSNHRKFMGRKSRTPSGILKPLCSTPLHARTSKPATYVTANLAITPVRVWVFWGYFQAKMIFVTTDLND